VLIDVHSQLTVLVNVTPCRLPSIADLGTAALQLRVPQLGITSNSATVVVTESEVVAEELDSLFEPPVPLSKAQACKALEGLHAILNHSAISDDGDFNPAVILLAASRGCTEIAMAALDAAVDTVPFQSVLEKSLEHCGLSLLSSAVLSGSTHTTAELLACALLEGVPLRSDDCSGIFGLAPLHWAAMMGNSSLIDVLFQVCPEAEAAWRELRNSRGLTPAELFEQQGSSAAEAVRVGDPVDPLISEAHGAIWPQDNGVGEFRTGKRLVEALTRTGQTYLFSGVALCNLLMLVLPLGKGAGPLLPVGIVLSHVLLAHQQLPRLIRFMRRRRNGRVGKVLAASGEQGGGTSAPLSRLDSFRYSQWHVRARSAMASAAGTANSAYLLTHSNSSFSRSIAAVEFTICASLGVVRMAFLLRPGSPLVSYWLNVLQSMCCSLMIMATLPAEGLPSLFPEPSTGCPSAELDALLCFLRAMVLAICVAVPVLFFPLPGSTSLQQAAVAFSLMLALQLLASWGWIPMGAAECAGWSYLAYWIVPSGYSALVAMAITCWCEELDVEDYLQDPRHQD